MNPEQILSQLRDVHSPEAITAWPPAIGWWILALIAIISCIAVIHFAIKYYRNNAWKKVAQKNLIALCENYQEKPSNQNLEKIIVQLKRCIATATNQQDVLSAAGNEWRTILQSQMNINDADLSTLTDGQYQISPPTISEGTLKLLKTCVKGLGKGVRA